LELALIEMFQWMNFSLLLIKDQSVCCVTLISQILLRILSTWLHALAKRILTHAVVAVASVFAANVLLLTHAIPLRFAAHLTSLVSAVSLHHEIASILQISASNILAMRAKRLVSLLLLLARRTRLVLPMLANLPPDSV